MSNVIISTNPDNIVASGYLNAHPVMGVVANDHTPIARFIDSDDVADPPAPAWHCPQTSEIYIHATEAGIDTETLRRNGGLGNSFGAAKAIGLLAHEAAHAAISDGYDEVVKLAPQHHGLLTTLEEIRVENHVIRRAPGTRSSLRASFTLLLEAVRDLDTRRKATVARAWTLVQGRTLAGIATMDETRAVDEAARIMLGDDTVDALTDLLQEVVTLTLPDDADRMIEICDEWVELVGEETGEDDDSCEAEKSDGTGAKGKGKSDGESKPSTSKSKGKGDKGDKEAEKADDESGGSGGDKDDEADDESDEGAGGDKDDDGKGEDSEDADDDYELGDRDSIESEYGDYDDDTIDNEGKELTDAALKLLAETMAAEWASPDPTDKRANALDMAAKVFGSKRTSKKLIRSNPTPALRRSVLDVANVLSNLALPSLSKVSVASTLPPGRLRSREAVRASAERAQSRMVTAQPWKGTRRRHSTARPLIVGIATDTSGSMRWAELAVAHFAYVWANAGHRIGARTAAVTFGDKVHPIARPGQILNHVVSKPASDYTEQCDHALAALDGVLHLSTPSYAARILVVVSDGCLVKGGETEKVTQWLRDFTKAGTHVVWVKSSAARSSSDWVDTLAKRLPNLTTVDPGSATGFPAINDAVLATVKDKIR